MDVAPVVLGEGVRFFGSHTDTALLDDPDQAIHGDPGDQVVGLYAADDG